MGHYSRTLKDYDGENTAIQVWCADLSEANIAAQITLQSNFGGAINDMTLGSLQTIRYGNEVVTANDRPSDQNAQRELKWRVDYRDTVTGENFHFTMGTADTSKLDPNNRKQAYIGDGADVDAFVTAAEAYVLSPRGNAIQILQIVLVGRNI